MQHGRKLLCWSVGAFIAALLVGGNAYAASFGSGADKSLAAPDVVRIDVIADTHKTLEMAPAVFPHGKHVAKMDKAGKDCSVCHSSFDSETPFAFKSLTANRKAKILERGFHDSCLGCHDDMGGPQSVECRVCHDAKAPAESAALPVRFDKSAHAVHVASKLIVPVKDAPVSSENCSACHGVAFDVQKVQLTSHESCVKCHLQVSLDQQAANVEKIVSGPVDCIACHSADGQAKFPVVKNAPRLMHNQSDATLLLPQLAEGKDNAGMAPVVFNHKAHEAVTDSCGVCHYSCADTKEYVEKHTAASVATIDQIIHDPYSKDSCVGCHNAVAMNDKNCAGCHGAAKTRNDASCNVCHEALPKGQSVAVLAKLSKQDQQKFAAMRLASKKQVAPIASADIPETVTIGMIASDFKPAVFPHRKVYEALVKGVVDNALAMNFHTSPETLCAACHHNVPVADLKQPSKCSACHGSQQDKMVADKNIPSLKAAYHQQCIACHTRMAVKPVAQDCAGCHEKAAR